jgi:hypothetical protein
MTLPQSVYITRVVQGALFGFEKSLGEEADHYKQKSKK